MRLCREKIKELICGFVWIVNTPASFYDDIECGGSIFFVSYLLCLMVQCERIVIIHGSIHCEDFWHALCQKYLPGYGLMLSLF